MEKKRKNGGLKMDWALHVDPDPDWAWVTINDAGEYVYEEYISSGLDAAVF